MDKTKQISIKINGKQQKVPEEQPEIEPYIKVKSKKNQTFTIVENEEVAAAREEEEDDFTWVLPDASVKKDATPDFEIPIIPIEDLRKTKGPSKIPHFPKKSKSSGIQVFTFKQFLVSILLAVVVGTGFGVMILKVVSDVNAGPEGAQTPPTTSEETPPPSSNNGKEEPAATDVIEIQLESLSTGVIQGGKFSTLEAANTVVSQVKSSGYAASAVEQDGSFFVFMGIGADQQSIAGIKAVYESTELEYFVKAFVYEGGSYKNAAKSDSEAIATSLPLFKGLLAQSSQAFGTGTIADAEWEKLSTDYAKVKEIKQDKLTEDMKAFITQIISAYESLQTFKTGGDKKVLWQSQQAALDAFSNYAKWVSKLS
ncbi:hypothetical protein [Fredinandcohnia sp. 179-A 10B2 NHS]|uniref:hypothetical protein n=1 Tax=Fredinandcohnia sp. 179-A 10B2 NHS TaxID=3235176 RepID=UPI0039A325B1